jgi:hypothetical protein
LAVIDIVAPVSIDRLFKSRDYARERVRSDRGGSVLRRLLRVGATPRGPPTRWVGGTHGITLATTNTGKEQRHLERKHLNFFLRGRSPSPEPATSSTGLN